VIPATTRPITANPGATNPVGTLFSVAALMTLAALLYFGGLGNIPFYTKGEPREALQVWEQVHTGDWILPLRNGTQLPSKPPLFHWLAGLVALLTGAVNELSLRLPSALSATAVILLVFWFGWRRSGPLAGFCAAMALATSFEWMRAARMARVDMVLASCSTTALVAFGVIAEAPTPSPVALFLFYLCLSLAVLTKGPVGLVLPVLVVVIYLACRRDLGRLRAMHFASGCLLAAVVAGVWYALAIHRGGSAFVDKQILGENLLRFLGKKASAGHRHPFSYYVPVFFAGFLPWSLLIIPLGGHLYQRRRTLDADRYLYPLVWCAVVVAFYSLAAGKRAPYILAAYPAAALLLGAWWQELATKSSAAMPLTRWIVQATGALVAAAALIAVAAVLAAGSSADFLERLRPVLHPRDQANLPLIGAVIRAHRSALVGAGLALAALGLTAVISAHTRSWVLCFVSLAASAGCVSLLVSHVFHPAVAAQRTFRPFLQAVGERVPPEHQLVFYRGFDYGAAFYSQRHLPVLRHPSEIEALDPTRPAYMLIWESEWGRLTPGAQGHLGLVARSDGTGPTGRDHLLLVQVRFPR